MNRFLEKLNLFGVLILAGLCVMQWRINRSTNLELARLQKLQHEQTTRIADQEKTLQGQLSDLDTFRGQLTAAKASEKELEKRAGESERNQHQLTVERDQLKSSVTNWAAAVAARDKQLQRTTTELKSLVEQRDEAIEKHNELAKRHNQLVADFNRAATNTVTEAKTRN